MTIAYFVSGSSMVAVKEWLYRCVVPSAGLLIIIACWSVFVELAKVPSYILPAPRAVMAALINDWPVLGPALWVTTQTTLVALLLAVVGEVAQLLSLRSPDGLR